MVKVVDITNVKFKTTYKNGPTSEDFIDFR